MSTTLDLERFLPYQLSVLSNRISQDIADLYQTRHSLSVTEWRMIFRRTMNTMDSKANTQAIDSLLNYETVKYFGNEAWESRRYDEHLQTWEKAAIRNQVSLATLNSGQSAIIAIGMTLLMFLAADHVMQGTMTIGDLVLVNAFLLQLYMPLHFLGFVYREIKHSLADMERMFSLLDENREIQDKPGAVALQLQDKKPATIRFDHVNFSYDANRQILFDVSFEIPAGRTQRLRKINAGAPAVSLL